MPLITLRDLYLAELRDLYDAEQQVLAELPALSAGATSSALRSALDAHLEQTRIQLQRLELVLRKLGVEAGGHACEAMRGLIADGRTRLAEAEKGDVLDAAIIGAAQRIEHYEMAAYGCARTYARTLGDEDARRLLQQTLDEEGAADHHLTRLAAHGINQAAGEDVIADTDRQRERLRYVSTKDLREFKYRFFRVVGTRDEDLGSLDGVIVESRTDRPVYFVIDAGGWFVGHRYLVPIGVLQAEEITHSLRANLDREAIQRYPPFNPSSFEELNAQEPPAYDERPEYCPPTWLMTGVWMTEGSGFACVPPRAESDLADARK